MFKEEKKKEKNINPRVSQTSNEKIMSLSKWAIVKNQDLLKNNKHMD